MVVHAGDVVLLLKRHQPFDFWQSVTGSLDHDETADAAARRELVEETGFTDQGELIATGVTRRFVIDPRWRDRYAPGVTENEEHEYHYRLDEQLAVTLCEEEHSDHRWLPLSAAIDAVWSWTNRQALEALRDARS